MNLPEAKLLFVYGTLKRGCSNHPFLAGHTFVGPARTAPGYRLYDLGEYPGMVRDSADQVGVTGEVWSVASAGVAELDLFEGVDQGLYRRERVNLRTPFADELVETYFYALSAEGRPTLGDTWVE